MISNFFSPSVFFFRFAKKHYAIIQAKEDKRQRRLIRIARNKKKKETKNQSKNKKK